MSVVTPVRRLVSLLSVLLASPILFAGENVWTTSGPPGEVFTLAIDPSSLTLYAGSRLGADRTVAFRSSDRGASWVESGEAPPGTSLSVLAVSPTGPAIVFAGLNAHPAIGGELYRSVDAGNSWVPGGLLGLNPSSFALPPDRPDSIYAGGTACYCIAVPCFYRLDCSAAVSESNDSGSSWRILLSRMGGRTITAVALDPSDSRRIYAAGDGGVFVTSDRGAHWSASNSGLEACPSVLALLSRPDGGLFAGTGQTVANRFGCGGVFRSDDGGQSWNPTGFPPHYVTALAVDPTEPQTVYAGTARIGFFSPDGGVFRTSDGGQTWERIGVGLPDSGVLQIVVEPSGNGIHAGTSAGVYDISLVPGARPPVIPPRSHTTRTLPPRP
jgi:photosystem II stability/assembly factor-like uncharacterized protein